MSGSSSATASGSIKNGHAPEMVCSRHAYGYAFRYWTALVMLTAGVFARVRVPEISPVKSFIGISRVVLPCSKTPEPPTVMLGHADRTGISIS